MKSMQEDNGFLPGLVIGFVCMGVLALVIWLGTGRDKQELIGAMKACAHAERTTTTEFRACVEDIVGAETWKAY